jgi:hypothetical protein
MSESHNFILLLGKLRPEEKRSEGGAPDSASKHSLCNGSSALATHPSVGRIEGMAARRRACVRYGRIQTPHFLEDKAGTWATSGLAIGSFSVAITSYHSVWAPDPADTVHT